MPGKTRNDVGRACDRCHARKVKCDGGAPCSRCVKLSCVCAINRPLLPKGPVPKPRVRCHRPIDPFAFLNEQTPTEPKSTISPTASSSLPSLAPDSDPGSAQSGSSSSEPQVPQAIASDSDDWWKDWAIMPSTSPQPLPEFGSTSTDLFSLSKPLDGFEPSTSLNLASLDATTPWLSAPSNYPFGPPVDPSPLFTLTCQTLIRPQLEVYFQRIYPMLLVYPRSYIFDRLDDPTSLQRPDFLAVVLAMTALSLIHPLYGAEQNERATRAKQCRTLLDEACRLTVRWNHGTNASLDSVFTTYLIFGILIELGYADAARLRLGEAMYLALGMRLNDPSTYVNISTVEAESRRRMFWVLSITERVHSLQRGGNIVFPGPIQLLSGIAPDTSCPSLRYLAFLFNFVDGGVISCWNNYCPRGECTNWTADKAVSILSRLKGTPQQVFGDDIDLSVMTESQRSDLMVTWQWVRNRLWRLSADHGLATEDGPPELSVNYVVDVASSTVNICRQLSLSSMEAHGAGFVQKLYDIASIVTSLLQSDLHLQGDLLAVAQTDRWGDALQALYHLVAQHRKGKEEFATNLFQAVSCVSNIKLLLDAAPVVQGVV